MNCQVLKHIKHKMQRSPHKTNIFKGQAASRMHYAKFYDIFSEDLNSTDAQYFIENAASNMIVVEEDIRTPLLPLTSQIGVKQIQNREVPLLPFLVLE